MKRSNVFVIVTGMVSLAANILAILSYLSEENPLFGWPATSSTMHVTME